MAGKRGRPPKEIDWPTFEKLCSIQCTLAEIAAWFCCSEDTIERKVEEEYGLIFADVFKEKKRFGKISLRRTLFQKAQEGNPTLLIWLSKQHLGMSDKTEAKTENKGTLTVNFSRGKKSGV